MAYALLITGKHVKFHSGTDANAEGGRLWLCVSDDWNSPRHFVSHDVVPGDIKTWPTEAAARAYADSLATDKFWGLWWCVPTGTFEVVPVEQKFQTIAVGWRRSRHLVEGEANG